MMGEVERGELEGRMTTTCTRSLHRHRCKINIPMVMIKHDY